MKKIPDPGKFSVSPLYKRASVKLMHMGFAPQTFAKWVLGRNLALQYFENLLHCQKVNYSTLSKLL